MLCIMPAAQPAKKCALRESGCENSRQIEPCAPNTIALMAVSEASGDDRPESLGHLLRADEKARDLRMEQESTKLVEGGGPCEAPNPKVCAATAFGFKPTSTVLICPNEVLRFVHLVLTFHGLISATPRVSAAIIRLNSLGAWPSGRPFIAILAANSRSHAQNEGETH